jgi:hypothetical protein
MTSTAMTSSAMTTRAALRSSRGVASPREIILKAVPTSGETQTRRRRRRRSSTTTTRAGLLSDSSRATTSSSAALPPRSRAEAAGQDLGALLASLVRSLPVIGVDKATARRDAKDALLNAIARVERGVTATEADKEAIDALAVTLERVNPNARALSCDLLNGEWELLYTTSASIIGANKPWPFRPLGPIYQTIDVPRLRAANRETFPFFNAVDADLTPTSAAAVDVKFVKFKLFGGLIRVDAPAAARGALRCVLSHTGPHTTPFAL